jgi:hypothetical protein
MMIRSGSDALRIHSQHIRLDQAILGKDGLQMGMGMLQQIL